MDKQELLDSIRECEKASPEKLCALRAEIERLTAEAADLSHARDSLHTLLRQTLSSRGYFSGTPNDTPSDIVTRVVSAFGELEADVVWAVRHAATCTVEPAESLYGHPSIEVPCNGTPADILRAVREARNGVS